MTKNKSEISSGELWAIVIFLLGVGFFIGLFIGLGNIDNSQEELKEHLQVGYDMGYNECRDQWINSIIGLEDPTKGWMKFHGASK